MRHKEREETIELGRKLFDEIVARLPAKLGKKALKRALKRLELEDDDELMVAIARQAVSDDALMEALVPGSPAATSPAAARPAQARSRSRG